KSHSYSIITPSPTTMHPLSLHDALPISMADVLSSANQIAADYYREQQLVASDHANRFARTLAAIDLANADVRPIRDLLAPDVTQDRKSTRLNSSHLGISYAVFCLKKKKR